MSFARLLSPSLSTAAAALAIVAKYPVVGYDLVPDKARAHNNPHGGIAP